MAITSCVAGLVLLSVAAMGYFLPEKTSLTALIPAIPGLLLILLGAIAAKPAARMHAMHGAVLVGLLAFLGTAPGLWKGVLHLAGTPAERPAAVLAQSATALVAILFVVLCVRSFIAARKARQAAQSAAV